MPRDSNGNYSKPAGTTAVSGNIIDPTSWNSLTTDLGTEITNSMPRDGSAAMTGVAKLADGSSGAPGLAFGSDLGVGMYRKTTQTASLVSGTVEAFTWSPTTITMNGAVTLTGGITQAGNTTTNGNISVTAGQTFTATTTNTTTGLSAITGASKSLGPFVGSTVTGTGIPANTTITAITYNGDNTVATITMSNAATASGSITVTAGGTVSAAQDPVLALHVATKQYVDGRPALQSITATVAANALTVGYVPQGAVSFRNPTLTNGAPVSATPATLSLVVPSTATLGTANGILSQLALILLYNAGTPALGIVNLAGGLNLDETALISTTAISAAATSASVVYSTSAITNSPFRVVGFINSTQATAGTWATTPSLVQGAGGQSLINTFIKPALNSSGAAPVYAPRAWVKFTGATGAIVASGNVSSVTRNAAGDYTVNFTTALPTDYVVHGSGTSFGGNAVASAIIDLNNSVAPTTTACRIFAKQSSTGNLTDPTTVYVSFVG